MSLPKPTADNYERAFPSTGISDAQKQERMERKVFKAERVQDVRTGRNRGVVFSIDNPWLNSLPASRRREPEGD